MTPAVPTTAASLPAGGSMPLLGFGTWQLEGGDAQQACEAALEAGYRHLDTATIYGNEREVGAALEASGVDGVFVTTKCPPDDQDRAREVLEQSLEALGLDSVDLWLIHWPPNDAVKMWQAFVQAQADGLAKDVGVSNFSLAQLDELEQATGVKPSVNQIKWSPLLFDRAVEDGHRERGIVLEGYSGLKGGTLENDVITGIAERLGRTPAQVINRWHLEHGVVTIPKSTNPERIRSNADLDGFSLSADDLSAMDALGG
ncbi:MAG: aldo/keto reductase [Frankiales bacterium]|jgi:2,5-diketo-D-gluconate reductase A|nr:aldo/keto reductase [Frankiales bacterium]